VTALEEQFDSFIRPRPRRFSSSTPGQSFRRMPPLTSSELGSSRSSPEGENTRAVRVAGIVQTGKYKTLGEEPTPFLDEPIQQRYIEHAVFVVRTAGNPLAFGRNFAPSSAI